MPLLLKDAFLRGVFLIFVFLLKKGIEEDIGQTELMGSFEKKSNLFSFIILKHFLETNVKNT
jgi:hypothetical protein